MRSGMSQSVEYTRSKYVFSPTNNRTSSRTRMRSLRNMRRYWLARKSSAGGFDLDSLQFTPAGGVGHGHRLAAHRAILDVALFLDRQIEEQSDDFAAVRTTDFGSGFEHMASVRDCP